MERIGQFFTPLEWAKFAVREAGLVPEWLSGKSVLDPAMGAGALLAALVEAALEDGHPVEGLPFPLLHGIEIDPQLHAEALDFFRRRYGADLSTHLICADLFDVQTPPCDLIMANPPWVNFSDLPESLKPAYKSRFVRYGLAPHPAKLLLGGARVDVAALFVQKTLLDHLVEGGRAWYFLPLSLFLNDGAHRVFRAYTTGGVPFSVQAIWDFQAEPVFSGVSTRWGLVSFLRDALTMFPIPYRVKEGSRWRGLEALPLFEPDDPLSVSEPGERAAAPARFPLEKRSLPRQGVNTGGANGAFFFSTCESAGESCLVDGRWRLPKALVHPLLTARQFGSPDAPPGKWVLLPYTPDGKLIKDLSEWPLLQEYLEDCREALENRRGALVAVMRARGLWWSLQGVGPYSFAPYKVVWEAYGRKTFRPRLFAGTWQANQSLQAFVPCWSAAEATRVLEFLQQPEVENYLLSLRMAGTANWAQPGRIRRLLEVSDEPG